MDVRFWSSGSAHAANHASATASAFASIVLMTRFAKSDNWKRHPWMCSLRDASVGSSCVSVRRVPDASPESRIETRELPTGTGESAA